MRMFPYPLKQSIYMQNGFICSKLMPGLSTELAQYYRSIKFKSANLTRAWSDGCRYLRTGCLNHYHDKRSASNISTFYDSTTKFRYNFQCSQRTLYTNTRQEAYCKSNNLLSRQNRNYFTSAANLLRMSTDENVAKPCGEDSFKPREIKFLNSYGHLAGLEWGRCDAPNKILCVHGWLDNAGSFEPLIPYILNHKDNHEKYHIVALDMPGVGHSSHKPPGSEYTMFSNIIEMRRVTQQLGWHQNLTIFGHSYGGHLALIYSCVYPQQVSTIVSIDTTHPITRQVANWNVSIGNAIEHYFKCENYGQQNDKLKIVVPVYSVTDALKRLMEAHGSSLTYESAKVMFKRGATKHENGSCTFNRDVRHRAASVEFRPTDDMMLKMMESTFRPDSLLIIRATLSPYHRPEMCAKYYELYEKNCRLFQELLLEGTHHVHMNSPAEVGSEICKFLELANNASSAPQIDKPNL